MQDQLPATSCAGRYDVIRARACQFEPVQGTKDSRHLYGVFILHSACVLSMDQTSYRDTGAQRSHQLQHRTAGADERCRPYVFPEEYYL